MSAKWTVMVYMAAEDSHQLDELAVADLREMERVGSNEHVNVIVQINRAWPRFPQRYKVMKGEGESKLIGQDDQHTNMGHQETLEAFLTWAAKNKECQADHYLLVLWGHAYGLGFGRDHDDPLALGELKSALDTFNKGRPKRTKLELLGANACAMSYAEAAFQLKDSAQYLVASQIAVPFAGWPYESILKGIKADTSPEDLGRIIVDSYVNHFVASASRAQVSMTLLNLRHASSLKDKVKELAKLLLGTIHPPDVAGSNRLMHVRDVFRASAAGDIRPLIDLFDLCEGLNDFFEDLGALEGEKNPSKQSTLPTELKGLIEFLEPADEAVGLVPMPRRHRENDEPETFFVRYHKRHPKLEGLHGVGIFAPFVTDEQDLKRLGLLDGESDGRSELKNRKRTIPRGREEYEKLELVKGTRWAALVYEDLHQEISSEIWTSIDATGTTNPADRSGVTQMLISIDSVFNRLDRTLASTKEGVRQQLMQTPTNGGGGTRATGEHDGADRARSVMHFGPPFLQLVVPPDAQTQVATLEQEANHVRLSNLTRSRAGNYPAVNLGSVQAVVELCTRVEKAIQAVERATRRILTHSRFGLGPPSVPSVGLGPKPSGVLGPKPSGVLGPKPSGVLGPKPSGVLGPKPSGVLGTLLEALAPADGDGQAAEMADLFEQIGGAMRQLEEATTNVESTAAAVLTDPTFSAGLTREERARAAAARVGRSFRALEETSTLARRIVQRVLAHPVYGLGPGPESLGTADREEFAEVGGLSRLELRLL